MPAERADGEDSDSVDTEGSAQAEASVDVPSAGDKLAAAAAAKANEASTADSGAIGAGFDERAEAQRAKQAMQQGGPTGGAAAPAGGLAALQAKVAAAERHAAGAEPAAGPSPRGRQLQGSLSIFERQAAGRPAQDAFTIPTAPQWEEEGGAAPAQQGRPSEEGGEEEEEGEEQIAGLSASPDVAVNLLPAGVPLSSAAAADRAALESWRRSSSMGSGGGGGQCGSLRGGLRRRTTSTQGEP